MSSTSDESKWAPAAPTAAPPPEARLAYFDLTAADAERLRAYRAAAEPAIDGIIAQFYDHLLAFPPLKALLEDGTDRIDRLKEKQRDYFLSLADARFDQAFVDSRMRIGAAHAAIGLDPMWYFGAFSLYTRLIVRQLVADSGDGAKILPIVESLIKAIFLDVSLTMRSYIGGGFVEKNVAVRLAEVAELAEAAVRTQAETDRLKEELGTMVVHDLKNPVNGILMLVQLALRKGADLPEAHRGYLTQIQLTCDEIMRLIENLLHIAKIEEGRMPVTREAVAVQELVDEVVTEYRPSSAQAGRPLRTTIPADLPAVAADRGLLKRVLVNLVVNALRHSASPTIEIAAAATPTGAITLQVIDRGRGIPIELQAKVFEKFASMPRSPADAPRTDTGLGLPFCKLAVEEMGGKIVLNSTPGTGTVFTVTLPPFAPTG